MTDFGAWEEAQNFKQNQESRPGWWIQLSAFISTNAQSSKGMEKVAPTARSSASVQARQREM